MHVRHSQKTLDRVLEFKYCCTPLTCSQRYWLTCKCWLFQADLLGQLWALSYPFLEAVSNEALKPAVLGFFLFFFCYLTSIHLLGLPSSILCCFELLQIFPVCDSISGLLCNNIWQLLSSLEEHYFKITWIYMTAGNTYFFVCLFSFLLQEYCDLLGQS